MLLVSTQDVNCSFKLCNRMINVAAFQFHIVFFLCCIKHQKVAAPTFVDCTSIDCDNCYTRAIVVDKYDLADMLFENYFRVASCFLAVVWNVHVVSFIKVQDVVELHG